MIWIRIGNVTTSAIAELLSINRSRIEDFDATADEALLGLPLTIDDDLD